MNTTPEPLWTSTDVSRYLGVPPATLHKWAHSGAGPRFYKVGRHRRYHPEDVRRWLDQRPQGGEETVESA